MNFSVIVPIKNQFKIVKKCLDSIARHYKNEQVVLIDDGSTEIELINLIQQMQTSFNWKVITNKQSLGHTKACEQGINETSCANFFLLNSDTILTEKSLVILSKVLNDNGNVAVVGPRTSSATGPQFDLDAYANRWSWSVSEIEDFAKKVNVAGDLLDIDLVNGFCFGMKRFVFDQIGGFDPVLTCYGNEKELLVRVRKAGYRTVYVSQSYVHHFGKMSYSRENINIAKCQKDGDRYILKKHGTLK